MKNQTIQIATTINVLGTTSSRIGIALLALDWVQGEKNLEYMKDLSIEDIPHNLDTIFEELRTIHSIIYEEIEELREHKNRLNGSTNVQ
jgi:lipoate synthase